MTLPLPFYISERDIKEKIVSVNRKTFRRWEDFPRPIAFGPRCIRYERDAVLAWIASRPEKGKTPKEALKARMEKFAASANNGASEKRTKKKKKKAKTP